MTAAESALIEEAWGIQRHVHAADRYQKLVELGGRTSVLEVVNAVIIEELCDSGKYEEAHAFADRLLKEGSSAWSLAASSVAAMAIEGPARACELAEKALGFDPSNGLALSAAYTAAAACGKREKSCDFAARLVHVYPNDDAIVALHICTVGGNGDVASARGLLDNAPPNFAASPGSELVAAFFARVEKRYAEAAEHVGKASALEPHATEHWLLQAEFLLKIGGISGGESLAKRALAFNPRCERAHEVMLHAAQLRRDWDLYLGRKAALEACTPYNVAIEHCRAGDNFIRQGLLESAARAYQMNVDSDHGAARRLARLGLIGVRLRQRRWAQLMPMLAEFESETPVPPIVVLARAGHAAKDGNWDEALGALEAVDEEGPDVGLNQWLLHYLWRAHRVPRLVEVAKANLAGTGCADQTAFFSLLGLYRAKEDAYADAELAKCLERFPDSQMILWMQVRRLRARGDKKAASAIWRQLSPQMRAWNPEAPERSPVVAWMRTLGLQFKRRFSRW